MKQKHNHGQIHINTIKIKASMNTKQNVPLVHLYDGQVNKPQLALKLRVYLKVVSCSGSHHGPVDKGSRMSTLVIGKS